LPPSSREGPGFTITGGNASQLPTAQAAVITSDKLPRRKRGSCSASSAALSRPVANPTMAGAGLPSAPAVGRCDLSIDDIDLWELNEAFAVQVIYCREKLGARSEKSSTSMAARRGHPTA
jgi:acetyl-CoA C-acetyltransferase/acetyl-CoA acyltransferase